VQPCVAYLSQEATRMFTEAGFPDAIISGSNDLGVFPESVYFFFKAHDPAVGHRTEDRNAELFSRFHIGCPANRFFVSMALRQKPCFLKRVYP